MSEDRHETTDEDTLNNARKSHYQKKYMIVTKGRADMVIHGQKLTSSNPAVLFEIKRPRDKVNIITLRLSYYYQ